MNLRHLGLLLIVFLVGLIVPQQGISAAEKKLNILLLLSDDHSYPYLSCYGDANVKTPNLDRLAAEGMKFHRFFTCSPQCVPSRAGYMTGRSPVAARMTRFSSPLPANEITFPEVLRQHGYYVGVCGRSYHLDGSTRSEIVAELFKKHNMKTFEQRFHYVKTGADAVTTTQMSEFLSQKPAEQPFFLWVNFSDPHHPWNADPKHRPDPAALKLPAHFPDLPGVREQFADYCGEINRLDGTVQAILDLLKDRGLAENTLVVFAGDNGMALPHGKGSLYDPGCNVPFVIRWPGVVKAGGESKMLLSGEDVGPTLLAAAGVEAPQAMSGQSFLPLLKGIEYKPRKYVFTERGSHGGNAPVSVNMTNATYDLSRAVRTERFKFIYNCTPWVPYAPVDSAGGQAWKEMTEANAAGKLAVGVAKTYFSAPRPVYELYDLDADPSELANLSGQPEHAAVELELRSALAEKMLLDFDYLPLPDLGTATGDGNQPKKKGGKKGS